MTLADAPVLSVIIPVYNGAAYVGQAIESVLAQNCQAHETIVVDDGSTDETPQVLDAFRNRIQVIRQENLGVSEARNRGIQAARGEWIAFLDADDLWLPEFERKMLQAAAQVTANVGVICCGWQYISPDGNKRGAPVVPPHEHITLSQLVKSNFFPLHAAIVRHTCVEQVEAFDSRHSSVADWDFWLRIAHSGFHIHRLREILVLYRQVPGSMSRHVGLTRDDGLAVLDKFFARQDITPEIRALQKEAYGYVRLWAGANFHAAGQIQEGLDEFEIALGKHPSLLGNLDTYYAIICAEQPLAFKGTGQNVDLKAGEARLKSILDKVFAEHPDISVVWRKRAYELGYLTLGELAYNQGNRCQAVSWAKRSLLAGGSWRMSQRVWWLLIKSLIGKETVDRLRGDK